MITNAGMDAIGRTLASSLNAYIAVGVGASPANVNNTQLDFEVYRAPVRVRSYDATTGQIIYAATVPDALELNIAEVGLIAGGTGEDSRGIITMFDQSLEEWSAGTWVTANSRLGGGLRLAAQSAVMDGASRIALTDVKQTDRLQVAYFGAGGSVQVRLGNTVDDYRSFTFSPVAGYNVISVPVSELATTGTPNLTSANIITVTHTGTGNVIMDAIKISAPADEEVLVDRQLVSPMKNKIAGMPLDLEFPLAVTR